MDLRDEVSGLVLAAGRATTTAVNYIGGSSVAYLALGACLVIGVALFLWDRRREHAELLQATGYVPQRRGRALKRVREKYVDGLLANDFIEMIQYRLYHREITPDEAQRMYRRLAGLLSYRGLYPSTTDLKALIKLRLANKEPKASIPGKPEIIPAPVVQVETSVVPLFTFKKAKAA